MNEEIIWNFLISKLKNPYGTAALMGNLFAESSLNPINATGAKKLGLTNEQYTAIVDSHKNDNFVSDGVAYGLAQWRYHTRKLGLLMKAKNEKKSVGDIQLQLNYLWQELQNYKTVLNTLLDAKDIRSASDVVLLKYEKPAGKSEAVMKKRASYGEKYFNKYNGIKVSVKKDNAKEIFAQLKGQL